MLEIFIPTKRNNYHAYLLRTPALILFVLVAFLLNSVAGILPVSSVSAEVVPATLLSLHNQERAKAGLPPLKLNANLTNSAQHKALAMLENNCWSHYCPDGESPWDFFTEAGYNYYYAGENLAEGFFDNSQAMVAWMNSPTHRDNILRADFTEVGFGIVQGDFQNIPNNIIIVVHFGTPQPAFQQAQISGSNDQVLEAPEILYPLPGSVVSSADFDVSGLAPNASLVNLYDHGGLLGSAAVDEGIFTYRANNFVDGEHSLHAVSEIGTWESGPSAPVGFMVDTQADPITADQILVISNDNGNLIIQINAPSLQEVTIMLNGHQYKFAAITSNIWQAEIPLIELQATAKFFISNLDKGDHEWNGELSTSSLLEQAEFVPSFAPGLRGVSGGWDFNVSRAGVNAAFLIILCVLFGLDFTILSKTGLTSHNRSRTHLHFAALVIILLVTMGTSLAGNIGPSGLTSF